MIMLIAISELGFRCDAVDGGYGFWLPTTSLSTTMVETSPRKSLLRSSHLRLQQRVMGGRMDRALDLSGSEN